MKYAIEKAKGTDLVHFFDRVKSMVAKVESVPPDIMMLDGVLIPTKNLMQVLSSIYGKSVVKKTHLLTLIQTRSQDDGVNAADLTAILLVDFVKCRDKEAMITGVDLDELAASKSSIKRRSKTSHHFEAENPDDVSFLKSRNESPSKKSQDTLAKNTSMKINSKKPNTTQHKSKARKDIESPKNLNNNNQTLNERSPLKNSSNYPDERRSIANNGKTQDQKGRSSSSLMIRHPHNPQDASKRSVFFDGIENDESGNQAVRKEEKVIRLEDNVGEKQASVGPKKRVVKMDPTKEKKILV